LARESGRQFAPFNEGIYSLAVTEKTYRRMARAAEQQIVNGAGAILDATFGQAVNREKVVRVAEKHKAPLFLIHCFASDEIIRARLTRRAEEGKDISDGRWEIYLEQKAAYQPLHELPLENSLELNTEAPADQLARECEKYLRARLQEVRAER